jgi:hypothetical protein
LYDALVTDAIKRNAQSMDMHLTAEDVPFLRVIFGEELSDEIEDEEIIQGMNEMKMRNAELYRATYDQCQSLKAAYQ